MAPTMFVTVAVTLPLKLVAGAQTLLSAFANVRIGNTLLSGMVLLAVAKQPVVVKVNSTV